eukprot:scaffold320732_cov32-Tisochrysis_lutea.AAC.3
MAMHSRAPTRQKELWVKLQHTAKAVINESWRAGAQSSRMCGVQCLPQGVTLHIPHCHQGSALAQCPTRASEQIWSHEVSRQAPRPDPLRRGCQPGTAPSSAPSRRTGPQTT